MHQTPTVHISNCLWTNRLCMCLVIKRGKIEGTGETSHELQIKMDPIKINPWHIQSKQMTFYQRASVYITEFLYSLQYIRFNNKKTKLLKFI